MTNTQAITPLKERYLDFVTQHPKWLFIASLLLIVIMGVGR
jgi:hypothetical protein